VSYIYLCRMEDEPFKCASHDQPLSLSHTHTKHRTYGFELKFSYSNSAQLDLKNVCYSKHFHKQNKHIHKHCSVCLTHIICIKMDLYVVLNRLSATVIPKIHTD